MLVFSSAYNEYTVISKEYTGSLDFDITGVYCTWHLLCSYLKSIQTIVWPIKGYLEIG